MKELKYFASSVLLLWLQVILSVSSITAKEWKHWKPKILAILPQQQNYKERFPQYNPEVKGKFPSPFPIASAKYNSSSFYTPLYNYGKNYGAGKENGNIYLPYTGPKNVYAAAAIPIPTVSEFGEYCDASRPCNSARLLECIDSKCYCENSAHRIYDEQLKECLVLVGSHCNLNNLKNPHVMEPVHHHSPFTYLNPSNYLVNPRRRLFLSTASSNKDSSYQQHENPYEPRCVKNSVCKLWSGNKCECNDGYTETDSKMCLLDIDMPCKANECNHFRGLGCKKGICQCIDSEDKYVPLTRRCSDMNEVVKRYGAYAGKGAIVYAISRSLDLLQDIPLSLLGFPVG